MEDLYINPKITIPAECFRVSHSRSSGPGIRECPCFSEAQKRTLFTVLKNRMDKQGVFQVSSQQYRSQTANRDAALRRMAELIATALKPKPRRKKTRIPKRTIEKRLEDKKARSKTKQLRSGPREAE
ncbi:MAG: alternative ribosome rescue aminoacyl-tRNA hydrolase ArfB [Planctomycetota bacterium]|jgi:ribosome-associated protein